MIRDIERVGTASGLAMVQHVDGFGTRARSSRPTTRVARPEQFAMGFKLFYDEDVNLFGPPGAQDPARGAVRQLPVSRRAVSVTSRRETGEVGGWDRAPPRLRRPPRAPRTARPGGPGGVRDRPGRRPRLDHEVVALAGSAPVARLRRPVRRRARRLPERQPVGAAALHQRGRRAARRRRGRRPPGGARRVGRQGDPATATAGPVLDVADPAGGRGRGGPRPGCRSSPTAEGPGMVELALAAGGPRSPTRPWTDRLDDEVVADAVAGRPGVDQHARHPRLRHRPPRPGPRRRQPRALPAAGGRVLYGTDLGNGPLPAALNLREVALLVDAGRPTSPAGGADRPVAVRRMRGAPRGTEVPDGPAAARRAASRRARRTRGGER